MSQTGRGPTEPSSLEIHLLGPFRVVVDGAPIADRCFTRRKPKHLIKLLALQTHHQFHREQAMELLWRDSDPEAANNSLNKAIHMARRALEPKLQSAADSHFIFTQDQQIVMRAPERLWIDVDLFEDAAARALKAGNVASYETALELYGGDLLPEDLYEEWSTTRREQLLTIFRDLLAKVAQLYERRGQYQQAIQSLNKLVSSDPANEEAHRQLMRLYVFAGSKHQALIQYRRCCDVLRSELDVEPERATMELHEQIVAGQVVSPSMAEAERDAGDDKAVNSLAILPLVNASSDPNAEYLSDGITESIINNLSQLPDLRVMAWNTVFRFKGSKIDPQTAGRDLDVRAVLTGRVLEVDDRLVIKAELINVTDGSQLWGEHYNRRLADIFVIEAEISREISDKLRLKLTGDEQQRLAKRHTDNIEAYHAYLKGRYFWNKRTDKDVRRGLGYFKQAIDLDPCYALAHAGLADSYIILGTFGISSLSPKDAFPKAKEAAVKALEIDDTLAEAHASLAIALAQYDWDWLNAAGEFRRAIELKPTYATAHHWYAFVYLTAMERLDEAIAEEMRAQELEPLSLIINTNLGTLFYLTRQYDEAIDQYRKALEIDSNFIIAYWMLGLAYEQKSMFDESIAEFQTAIALSGGSALPIALLGHAYAMSGKKDEALKVLNELHELSKRGYISSYRVAAIYFGLREAEQAFEWLQRAVEERDAWLNWLRVDPVFDDLRSDRRFQGLLKQVGLPSTTL
jgi:DNA-binding SARP family transcriptional activator